MSRRILPPTLFGQLLLVFGIFGAAMIAMLLLVSNVSHEMYHEELEQTVNSGLAKRLVDADFLLDGTYLSMLTLHHWIGKLAEANPDVDIYLVDPAGGIVASSVPEREWIRRHVGMGPIDRFLKGEPLPIRGDDPTSATHEDVFSVAPFSLEGCPARYLYIMLRRDQYGPSAARLSKLYSVTEGVGVALLAALIAVVMSVGFLRLLTRRLSNLAGEMREFDASGGTTLPARPSGNGRPDEIDGLEASFFSLASRLRRQMDALRQSDETRRHLMANVSHDLRTPLTTLVTHLEEVTAPDSRLSPEERATYLRIAMKQAQRVIRLVDQILEAARLEAGQVQAHPEPFLLAELLQDVVQKFELDASQRKVDLRLELPEELRWVVADVALIERVLDNLIENALRFAPADSAVRVLLAEDDGRLRVSVTDTGVGLTAEDAARVSERFFRKDPGRSSPSGHAGLGLAIVQGILELHGGALKVESEPGQGATFSFDLPAYDSPPPGEAP